MYDLPVVFDIMLTEQKREVQMYANRKPGVQSWGFVDNNYHALTVSVCRPVTAARR